MNGIARIQEKQIASNVMTSTYGKDSYKQFERKHIAIGNLLYDSKKGIIKKSRQG